MQVPWGAGIIMRRGNHGGQGHLDDVCVTTSWAGGPRGHRVQVPSCAGETRDMGTVMGRGTRDTGSAVDMGSQMT